MKQISHNRKKQLGFSLIELLVSMSIFTVVLIMAVGSLLVVINANVRAQNMQQVMTNLSFAIDSISREVRTGSGFYCSTSDPGGDLSEDSTYDCTNGSYLSVVEGGDSLTSGSGSSRITYRFDSSGSSIERRVGTGSWFPITAPDVTITSVNFYVSDSDVALSGDEKQASVTIFITGYAGKLEDTESSFAVETTVSKRIVDIF